MITPYVPLVLRENLEKVGNPRHKKSVGNEFVSARLGRVGQKCRLLAVGRTCRRHVGDFPTKGQTVLFPSHILCKMQNKKTHKDEPWRRWPWPLLPPLGRLRLVSIAAFS